MEKQLLSEALKAVFGQLRLYHRDCSPHPNIITAYQPGQILLEPAATDMSWKHGGPVGPLRFMIASSFAEDNAFFHHNAKHFGHATLPAGSHFKVLDCYSSSCHTQVLLLHIPEPHLEPLRWVLTAAEEKLIEHCRRLFDEKIHIDPVAALQEPEWLARTARPTGLATAGWQQC
jgi:hypothetical protein